MSRASTSSAVRCVGGGGGDAGRDGRAVVGGVVGGVVAGEIPGVGVVRVPVPRAVEAEGDAPSVMLTVGEAAEELRRREAAVRDFSRISAAEKLWMGAALLAIRAHLFRHRADARELWAVVVSRSGIGRQSLRERMRVADVLAGPDGTLSAGAWARGGGEAGEAPSWRSMVRVAAFLAAPGSADLTIPESEARSRFPRALGCAGPQMALWSEVERACKDGGFGELAPEAMKKARRYIERAQRRVVTFLASGGRGRI